MKLYFLITIIFLLNVTQLSAADQLKYSLKVEKVAKQTFLLLHVTNESAKKIDCIGHGFLSENFTATDKNGNSVKETASLRGLRSKSRSEPPIPVAARTTKIIRFKLADLFIFKKGQFVKVKCSLGKGLEVDIPQAW